MRRLSGLSCFKDITALTPYVPCVHSNGLIDNVDDVEEVDADHTPTRAPPSSPARAQVGEHRCAAGEHCTMKTTPLNDDHQHVCLNCAKKLHGALCGKLWDERGDDCQFSVNDLNQHGRNMRTNAGVLICKSCMRV